MSPGLMKTQMITGIFFWAIRLSITFSAGLLPFRSMYPAAVLENHERGRNLRIVLRGHVNPIFALHSIVDLAAVRDASPTAFPTELRL